MIYILLPFTAEKVGSRRRCKIDLSTNPEEFRRFPGLETRQAGRVRRLMGELWIDLPIAAVDKMLRIRRPVKRTISAIAQSSNRTGMPANRGSSRGPG